MTHPVATLIFFSSFTPQSNTVKSSQDDAFPPPRARRSRGRRRCHPRYVPRRLRPHHGPDGMPDRSAPDPARPSRSWMWRPPATRGTVLRLELDARERHDAGLQQLYVVTLQYHPLSQLSVCVHVTIHTMVLEILYSMEYAHGYIF